MYCFSKQFTGQDGADDNENMIDGTHTEGDTEDNTDGDGVSGDEDGSANESDEPDDIGDQDGYDGDGADTDTDASELADLTTLSSRIMLSAKVNRPFSPSPFIVLS